MAKPRTFAALVDQDSIMVLEYRQEKAGFRVVDTRAEVRRFSTPESATDVVIQLLGEMNAKNVSLSIVLQHFGSFFHTIVLPPAPDEVIQPIIIREVQRSFNISDPAIAFATGRPVERREAAPAGAGQVPRQVLVAGAPNSVVAALHSRFTKARIHVEGLTVVPEVCRRLYDALDGSTEATAMLVCLANGPHVAFFVNGRLELAIEPPLALEGEAPLDSAVVVDQLERGAIFLRQQSRGMVATRLLLAAPTADYESLASTIEARTGMRVAQLGRGIGSPETVVAMGAVLAARGEDRIDLYPRAPSLEARIRRSVAGPAAITTGLMTAAALALFWAGIQVSSFWRATEDIAHLQEQVSKGVPAVNRMRESAQGRERIAGIRSNLALSQEERRVVGAFLTNLAASAPPGARLDSIGVFRANDGWRTTVFGRASGATGAAAVNAATGLYHYLQTHSPKLRDLNFQVTAYVPKDPAVGGKPASPDSANALLFTVTFVAPAPAEH